MNAGKTLLAEKKALLLVGSPKISGSSSESLGGYLLDRLREKGLATEKLHINRSLRTPAGQEELLAAADSCDILILAFPLYADSLPSGVIKAMELLAQNRQGAESGRVEKMAGAEKPREQRVETPENQGPKMPGSQLMLAICNSGFPEAHQNDTALAICRCFAQEAGFAWAGGLALGGGGAINGQPLEKLGGMMKHVRKSLDITAQVLAEGHGVPEEAAALIRKPFVPGWLYLLIGNLGWKMQAKKNGILRKINDRPYQQA